MISPAPDIWICYITFPNREEALKMSRELLDQRLIACANIYDGVTSVYRWEGSVREEREAALIAKTTAEKLDPLVAAAKRLHPYEMPCIAAYPVSAGFPPFLQWVAEETA